MTALSASNARSEKSSTPVVVIIGGGFGGLSAAKALAKAPVKVVLIDQTNHHLFQPLLYQVATAGLSPADIAQPIRGILRNQKNVTVVLDAVESIDLSRKVVKTGDLDFSYDYLIVATGARHAYFGRDDWEAYAPGLKSLQDAAEIRRRVLGAFEVAEKAQSAEIKQSCLTFVVVGAGPTGVEMAGAIAELAKFTLKKDFRHINPADAKVILIEAGPRVLPGFSPANSEKALRHLRSLQVDVRLNCPVRELATDGVTLDTEVICTRNVIWAAGNKASPLAAALGCPLDRAGRAVVNKDLTVPGYPEVQAVGDMIAATFAGGRPVPGVSPAAMQAGRHAGANIRRMLKGEPPKAWEYFDKGSMATIGRHAAVCEIGPISFGGLPAWLAWAFVHLFFLIGFRNRAAVFFQWAWAYFTYSKGARLISGPFGPRNLLQTSPKSKS